MLNDRRFQVQVLPDLQWEVLVQRVQHAEKLGFDLATTADQFVDWKSPSTPWFDPDSRESGGRISYYDSVEKFTDMAGRILDLGFSELGVYYPTVESQLPVFEQAASEVLPRFRNAA